MLGGEGDWGARQRGGGTAWDRTGGPGAAAAGGQLGRGAWIVSRTRGLGCDQWRAADSDYWMLDMLAWVRYYSRTSE